MDISNTEQYNEDEIRKCYQFLAHEKETEIRLIDPRKKLKPLSIFVHSEEEFLKTCLEYNGKYNIYAGINERTPNGTEKKDVIIVKTLVIDIDAIRKEGFEKEPATKEELDMAEKDCNKIISAMELVNCPTPIKINSGNGFQIWIAIPSIEINNLNRNKIEEKTELFQTLIKQRFEEFGSIDQIGDLPRIIKVWGTLNIKGTQTEIRNWRVAKVIGDWKRKEDFNTKKNLLELKKDEYESIEITPIEKINEEHLPKPIYYLLYEYKHSTPEGWMRIIELLSSFLRGIGLDKEKTINHLIEWSRRQPYRENGEEIEILKIIERIYRNQIRCPNFDKWLNKDQGYPYFGLKNKFIGINIGIDWKKFKNPISYYNMKTREFLSKEEGFAFHEFDKFTNFLEIADRFLKIQPIYYDKNKIWWVWNHKEYKWIMKDETDILNAIDKHTKNPRVNSLMKYELLEALRRRGRLNAPEEVKPSWIQFGSKIYDLDTDEEINATPEYFVTNPIQWEFGSSDETPALDLLFDSWVGEEHRQELYEILSFCLVPNYFIHRMFCLIGSGANGKSTFLKILERFIGMDNLTSSSLSLLLKQRFEGSKLFKKLICLMGETSFDLITNTDYLKKLTGEDMVRAEFKGKDGFDFRNYAKLIMATNSLPPTADKTEGFYRRWKIIKFQNKFTKECDILINVMDEEYKNLAFKCFKIAKRLWNERTFTNDGDFDSRKKDYEEESNPLMRFIKEECIKDINGHFFFQEFYEDLITYLEQRGYRSLSAIAVSKQLKIEGFDIKSMTKEEKNGRFIIGIRENNLSNISQ